MQLGIGYEDTHFFYVRGNLETKMNKIGEITKIVKFIKMDDTPESDRWLFVGNAYIDDNNSLIISGQIKKDKNLSCDDTVGLIKKYAFKGKSGGVIGKALKKF